MFTRQALLLVSAVTALAACSSSDEAPAQVQPALEGGGAGDAADAGADTHAEASDGGGADTADVSLAFDGLAFGATDATTEFTFSLNASGEGTMIQALSVAANRATLSLSSAPHTGVAFEAHAWTASGWDLYDVLSIADDGSNLAVTYLYCQDGGLTHFYVESFQDKMTWETASGPCVAAQQDTPVQVTLPALKAEPTPLDTGITINGADIQLGPSGGSIKLEGQSWRLVPFNTVDCTQCPGGPWIELHSMMLGDQQGCFTILYLHPDDKTKLQAAYTLCLPSLQRPAGWLDATWQGELVQSLSKPPLPRPPPPKRIGD